MAKMQMIQIDGEKLKDQLKARCFTLEAASLRMGRSAGYLKQIVAKGVLPTHTMRHITNEFDIKNEDIKPDPMPEPAAEPEHKPDECRQVSIQELMDLCEGIKRAAEAKNGPGLEAVVQAIDENFLPIRQAVEAVTQRSFRIATMTDLTEDSIARGVNTGMAMWWNNTREKIVDDIFRGVYDALFKIKKECGRTMTA